MDAMETLQRAADAVAASPLPLTDEAAQEFLEAHPLDQVFRLLSGPDIDKHAVEVISGALDKVLGTAFGTSLLPQAVGYAEAALGSLEPRLRRLGAAQLGRLLVLRAAGTEQRNAAAGALAAALEDPDTGVASEAAAALRRCAASDPPASYASLLDPASAAGGRLAALAGSRDATLRHRALALAVEAAGGGGGAAAAELLRGSGFAARLMSELDPRDPLSCLAALQLLAQLADAAGPPAARVLWDALLPRLQPLLRDADTLPGALPVAARLLGQAAAAAAAGGARGGGGAAANGGAAAAANGNGVAEMELDAGEAAGAAQLLHHLASLLDDSGDAGVEEEVTALDAAGQLALDPAGADLLAAGPAPSLLPLIAARALGRAGGAAPEVRVAALHALAAAAGGERAGAARDRGAAALPSAEGEDALRAAAYGGAAAPGWAASPAEAVQQLLQQPCVVALALRTWFAADVANTPGLLARLCDTRSESGQMCQWRHAAVNALLATATEAAAGAEGAEGSAPAGPHRGALAAALGQLRAAAAAGPYGNTAVTSGFQGLAQAFSQRITELQQVMCLRIEDHAKHLFVADLRGLEASVHALERVFKDIREHVARENAVVPKARALIQAARQQQEHLQLVAANLPAHLPSNPAGGKPGAAAPGPAARAGLAAAGGGEGAAAAAAAGSRAAGKDDAAASAAAGGVRRRDAAGAASSTAAPRWYVTQAELNSLASYMRGRLTLDKVNAALDEAAQHAEQIARWMAAARAHAIQRVPADDRKRAAELYHSLANKEGVRGQFWFTETELRNGAALRPDKTGKGLLMALRHLGRLSEVRANVEALGGSVVMYVLSRPNE
ncbi:MAG: hypothetical protein J3K34DRAFT_525133 [Monoraphidium minutum]|nr:MAG: hypothetical protein J3K34DRAFT_525133 [Monoraphidium minutum]